MTEPVRLRLLDWRLWASIAAVLLLTAVVIFGAASREGSADDRQEVDRLRAELDCRSRIAGEVTQAQGEVTVAVGAGLAALSAEDQAALAVAVDEYEVAAARLEEALGTREGSEDTCAT